MHITIIDNRLFRVYYMWMQRKYEIAIEISIFPSLQFVNHCLFLADRDFQGPVAAAKLVDQLLLRLAVLQY